MIVLLVLVAIATAVFIFCGSQTSPYSYLEKERFETEYGVIGLVKERKEQYKRTYTRNNIIGANLCVTALIPLFVGVVINENSDLLYDTDPATLDEPTLRDVVTFACTSAGLSTTQSGGISSVPEYEAVMQYLK